MRKFLIPNFLFYPNFDNSLVVNDSFFLFKKMKDKITNTKQNIFKFYKFFNFTLIYFYFGNFFIKNKLRKTLENLLLIDNNYFIISNRNFSFETNLENFIRDISKFKKYNINKLILQLNDKFYLPLHIFQLSYFYFLFFSVFLLNLKLNIVYFNLNLINSFCILKKKLIV